MQQFKIGVIIQREFFFIKLSFISDPVPTNKLVVCVGDQEICIKVYENTVWFNLCRSNIWVHGYIQKCLI